MALSLQLRLEPKGSAGAFVLSDEQVAAISPGPKVFPVNVTVNGRTLPLRLTRMGGENLIGFSKANRAAAQIELGEVYQFTVDADATERIIEVPDDLRQALDAADLAAVFAALAPSHRREYVTWITGAKQPATRRRRIEQTVERVSATRSS